MPISEIYSTDYLRELEPYFRIEVEGNALPPEQNRQMDYLVLTEEENTKASFEFGIRDPEAVHFDTPLFALQQKVFIYAGYFTEHEQRGEFEITEIKVSFEDVGIYIRVKGEEGGRLGRCIRRRVFTSGTFKSTIRKIAKHSGLPVVFVELDGFDFSLTPDFPLAQVGETDGRFLQRVCADYGLYMTVTSNKIYIYDGSTAPTFGEIEVKYNAADAHVMRLNAKQKKPKVVWVPIEVQDKPNKLKPKLKGKKTAANSPTVTSQSRGRVRIDAQGETRRSVDKVPKKTGSPEKKKNKPVPNTIVSGFNRMMSWLSGTPSGKADENKSKTAKKVAKRKKLLEGDIEGVEIDLKLGSMLFRIRHKMTLIGSGQRFDGDYTVRKVVHRFDGEFNTKIDCRRGFKVPTIKKKKQVQAGKGKDKAAKSKKDQKTGSLKLALKKLINGAGRVIGFTVPKK